MTTTGSKISKTQVTDKRRKAGRARCPSRSIKNMGKLNFCKEGKRKKKKKLNSKLYLYKLLYEKKG